MEVTEVTVVVLGVEALRGLIATAMLQPVFRATRSNFPRFPRLLWERTERSVRAAELYTLKTHPQDRFESQLVVLMNALGPLVVYGALLDAYAARPKLAPNPSLCAEMGTRARAMLQPGLTKASAIERWRRLIDDVQR